MWSEGAERRTVDSIHETNNWYLKETIITINMDYCSGSGTDGY